MLDSSFSDVFSCNLNPYSGPTRISKLKGALNGLCRLCSNISNPQNGLVLDGNFQCFPQSHGILQSCILEVAKNISECKSLLHSERSKLSVRAKASIVTNQSNVTGMEHKHVQLRYLAMAFRSVSSLSSLGLLCCHNSCVDLFLHVHVSLVPYTCICVSRVPYTRTCVSSSLYMYIYVCL